MCRVRSYDVFQTTHLALRGKVDEDWLQAQGVIVQVEYSDRAMAITQVFNANGEMQICNNKPIVNRASLMYRSLIHNI